MNIQDDLIALTGRMVEWTTRCERKVDTFQDQLDQLYKRVQKLEHKSPVPLYEEKWVVSKDGMTGHIDVYIGGVLIDMMSRYELAQIIKRLSCLRFGEFLMLIKYNVFVI